MTGINIKHHPLISVFIPVYNAGIFLRPAILSILTQTYTNLEILVIDDGSTDECINTLNDIQDKRLHIYHQPNSGKAVALNFALDNAKGKYWIIQDGDDLSYPKRIEKLFKTLLDNTELAAVYSGHDLLVGDMQFAPSFATMPPKECQQEIFNFRAPAHDATGMYRTELVKDLRFDPSLRIGQGIDFVLRVGELFPIALLGECLYTYRINYNSTIRKNPSNNTEWANKVRAKACSRRGLISNLPNPTARAAYKTTSRSKNNHIVSHCIKSVMDFRKENLRVKAIKIGINCLRLFPFDFYFYKPLFFSFLPISIINFYRNLKNS